MFVCFVCFVVEFLEFVMATRAEVASTVAAVDRHHLPEVRTGESHCLSDPAGEVSRQMEPVPFSGARAHYLEPHSESGSIHSRLVGHNVRIQGVTRLTKCGRRCLTATM